MNCLSSCCSIVALAVLAACAAPPTPPIAAAPAPVIAKAPVTVERCAAEPAKSAIGQLLSPQLEAAARYRAGASRVRVVKPGQMTTMEFDAGRLTLDVDARARVVNARCG